MFSRRLCLYSLCVWAFAPDISLAVSVQVKRERGKESERKRG